MEHPKKDRAESEVIISYLADKKQSIAEKKLSKKMLLALIICSVYLILLGSLAIIVQVIIPTLLVLVVDRSY